ncbi:MAG: hypothetical protein HY289_16825 [Planctomycetes bacterium]|nr:hypothetical protein [Planctomycetota bacterium]
MRKEVRMPVRQLTASPDGKYVFVQGNGEDLCRFRVQGDNLFEEQTSFRIASNGQLICISPDSKYVCLCAGGGNGGGHPDHPKTGGYSVFVYPVNDLRKPITGFGAGGYPRCVGIDPKSGVILTQNAGTPLILYPFTGDNKISEHKCPQLKGADVQEFSVSPQGGEAILRTQGSLIHIKINKGSTPPVG